jgi:hypothetical protein
MIRLQNEHFSKQKGVGAIQLRWMVLIQLNYAAKPAGSVSKPFRKYHTNLLVLMHENKVNEELDVTGRKDCLGCGGDEVANLV